MYRVTNKGNSIVLRDYHKYIYPHMCIYIYVYRRMNADIHGDDWQGGPVRGGDNRRAAVRLETEGKLCMSVHISAAVEAQQTIFYEHANTQDAIDRLAGDIRPPYAYAGRGVRRACKRREQ